MMLAKEERCYLFVVGVLEAGPEEEEVIIGWGLRWHSDGGQKMDVRCVGLLR